jgi:hypothetical protein
MSPNPTDLAMVAGYATRVRSLALEARNVKAALVRLAESGIETGYAQDCINETLLVRTMGSLPGIAEALAEVMAGNASRLEVAR